MENNLLIDNTYIPYGSSSLTRDIIAQTKKPSADVLSRIRSFGEEGEVLSVELKEHIELYTAHIVSGLEAIIEHRVLPSDIIITAHESYERLFRYIVEEALRRIKPSTSRIMSVDTEIINKIATDSNGDVYLALGAGFFHKLNVDEGTKSN
jgi:dihydropteroate synthase